MLKDITLGQFYPGSSSLHRIDPRVKIIITILYITAVFLAKNVYSFVVVILSLIILIMMSKIPFKLITKGLKPILFIISFTVVLNIFWTKGDTQLIKFGFIEIYLEGIIFALFMVVRIIALLIGTSVFLTYTTSPISLTDGIERLLNPLKKIKVPVHEFAMMMTIALRFIPTLIEETDKIMNAQKARGADFTTGSLINRAKALIPILIPLFISAFRRADELAIAMECRCYRGGEGRTRMTELHLHSIDIIFIIGLIIFCAMIVCVNIFLPGYSI